MTTPLTEAMGCLDVGQRAVWLPSPRITLSEWSDKNRVLSRVASAEPGRWMTARAEYQRGIMDAVSDPTVRTVVFMKSAQVGATEVLCNAVGYYMDQDPAPILVVQPNLDMARAWSTDRLRPMLRESSVLKGKVVESGRRDSNDTILHKSFHGGHLTIVGANSSAGLASRPIRVVLLDEVDRYPDSAGDEGDPVNLAVRRTQTFHNAKVLLTSTPTLKGLSRIEAAWNESDQRRFLIPCPHCEGEQVLEWKHLRWEDNQPETVRYTCPLCGDSFSEAEKNHAVAKGRWEPQRPEAHIVGFHINALYSPWARWVDLVREWLSAQQHMSMLQVFVNTVLGETWEEAGGFNAGALRERLEHWPTLPEWMKVHTMGVDVQDGFLEYAVYGWGAGEEWGLIETAQIPGDPGRPDVWAALDEVRARLKVQATAVDSGYHTDAVYGYVKARQGQGVVAVKGSSTPGRAFLPKKFSINNKARVRLYELGTESGKDLIYSRLRQTVPGPGFLHLPTTTPETWFEQIGAEKPERKLVAGRWMRRYVLQEGKRSEALDCAVYAFAVLRLFFPALQRTTVTVTPPPPEPTEGEVQPPPALIPQAPRKPQGFRIVGRLGGKGW